MKGDPVLFECGGCLSWTAMRLSIDRRTRNKTGKLEASDYIPQLVENSSAQLIHAHAVLRYQCRTSAESAVGQK